MSGGGMYWRVLVVWSFVAAAGLARGESPADWPGQFFTLSSLPTNSPTTGSPPVAMFASPAHWVIQAREAAQLGWAVAAGKFNGQGRRELAVAEPAVRVLIGTNNRPSSGRIVGYSFPKAGQMPQQEWTFVWPERGVDFRGDFSAGDMTGDGITDLALGLSDAGTNSYTARRQGLALLLTGQAGGGFSHSLTNWRGEPSAMLGREVLVADVNRDDRTDVLMTSANHEGRTNRAGGAELILAANSIPHFQRAWSVAGRHDHQAIGSALAVADINGDGWPDLLVGANGELRDGRRVGGVHWFAGSSDGFPSQSTQIIYGEEVEANFGQAIASLGDLDSDGCAEIVVGAPGSAETPEWPGAAYIFHGSRTGLVAKAAWSAQGWGKRAAFGHAVACAGDVNGDGRPDMLIGAPGRVDGQLTRPGIAALWLGRAGGFSTNADWRVTEETRGGLLGLRVGCAGDLDGDGLEDFYVGSPYHGGARTDSYRGRLDVFRGLRSGYGAEEKFPADGTVCRPGDDTEQTKSRIRVNELTRKASERNKALLQASNSQQQVVVETHAKQQAEQKAREAVQRENHANLTARQRLWWGAGSSTGLALVATGLWLNRRRVRAEAARRERERLARDLHDGLGSGVHRLQRLTELLNQVADGSPEALRYRQELLQTAQELGGSMDRTIWAVQPENDTLENLVSYLASYAPSVLRPNGIECELDLPAVLPARVLHGDTRQQLFLAVNEALNNVVKHSCARRAWLRVTWSEPWLEIIVEDDGCGWGEAVARVGGGNGLKNLQARLAACGGRCVFRPRPCGGARVEMRLPLVELTTSRASTEGASA